MKILITGGCGFVGSSLAILLKKNNPALEITCMDNLKRRGSEINISRLKALNIEFIHGDIRIKSDFDALDGCDLLIEAAAEPSVLAGLNGSTDYLIGTNLNGTVNCLNFALKHQAKFIFLSTSRVYPIRHLEQVNYIETDTRFELTEEQSIVGFSQNGVAENFPLGGARSLYGATKLSSELIIEEYQSTLGLRAVINRCGVITGPYQMGKVDQGVVVLWAARHFWKNNLQYIGYGGTGKQVRDILHIEDLYNLIDWQIKNFDEVSGETFNIGGGRECSTSLKELTRICESISRNKINISPVPETRTSDVRIYITDNQKIHNLSGWKAQKSVHEIMDEIFSWIDSNQTLLKPILN